MTSAVRSWGAFAGAVLLAAPAAVLPTQSGGGQKQVPGRTPPGRSSPARTPASRGGLSGDSTRSGPAPGLAASRLTVRQYRNAVADLIGEYQRVVPGAKEGGLRGEYYAGRDQSAKNRAIERVDSGVNFDFGTAAPQPATFDPREFSIRWHGSVFAPDTGDYEFVVHSDQSVRLYLNGANAPLADGSVRSANQTEFRGSIFLLGGRAYDIGLEFNKITQGVDDGKAKQRPSAHASIALMWRPPRRALSPIPAWCLYPEDIGARFIPTTPFPPDDRSMGFERGNSVSKEWDEATAAAAIEAADYTSAHIGRLAGVGDAAKDRKERVEAYCRQFVARAFRRPAPPDVEKLYIDRQFEEAPNIETAVKRVVLLALESPRFLYRDLTGPTSVADPYIAASELAFALWDTLPDPELRKAAEEGRLATREQVAAQAERMANDPRTWNKLRNFLLAWLKVDDIPEIVKDRRVSSDFDAMAASELRDSFELFLKNTAWSGASDYRELMTSPTLYLDGRLARLYGVKLPDDAPLQAVEAPKGERCGLLTQPYVLSRYAYVGGSDPIHRGVLIDRSLLGRVLNPPPAAFIPLPASEHPNLTTRERVALQTQPKFCQSCHGIINPLGFALERYDAIGRLRATDSGKPVNTSGGYRASDASVARFGGAADLAVYLANSEDAHRAFVQKLFQYMTKQSVPAYGASVLPELQGSFARDGYSIRNLMARAAAVAAAVHYAPKSK